MKNLGLILLFILICALLVTLIGVRSKQGKEIQEQLKESGESVIEENDSKTEENEITTEETTSSNIMINQIQNIASAKVMADSVTLEKNQLPEEIRKLVDITGKEADMIYAIYTKTDAEKEEFDLLHDYVLNFFDEENETSIKVSATKEENPIRDYFFQREQNTPSSIEGTEVIIFQYENRYIVNLTKGEYHLDIETNGLSQDDMVVLVTKIVK